jgi:hypothetical protein
VDWIDLAQDRDWQRALVNIVRKCLVSSNVGKFLSSCTNGDFSRKAQLHEIREDHFGLSHDVEQCKGDITKCGIY